MISKAIMIGLLAMMLPSLAEAQPAGPHSKRVAVFGAWSVVEKQIPFVEVETGKRGTYTVCSAFFASGNASLEFQATSDKMWKVFVATSSWNYKTTQSSLIMQSGASKMKMIPAFYAGNMISANSFNMKSPKRFSVASLMSFLSQRQPIIFLDSRNRKLVTFPNNNSSLEKAFVRALSCFSGVQ